MKLNPAYKLAIFIALNASSMCLADNITGKVVVISDGDTITVLTASTKEYRIRLNGIDAPEKAQPFGQASKKNLSGLIGQQVVSVEWSKQDRYGRTLGKITLNGKDINLEQVKAGMAWHYKKYQNDQLPDDREKYAEAENSARSARVGLWQDSNPMPPWGWRHPSKH